MKYFQFDFQELKILQGLRWGPTLKEISDILYLSPPALSLKIKRLESKVNSSILERNRKQIGLTRTGEITLEYVDKILQLFDEADSAIKYFKKLRKMSLTIGSNPVIGRYFVKRVLDLFCKYYSCIYLTLILESTHLICWEIFKGNVDLGILLEEEIPSDLYNSLYIEPLFKESIVLILPNSYKIRNSSSARITCKELYNFDFIGLIEGLADRKIINRVLTNSGIEYNKLKIKFELDSTEAIKRSVRAGLGVSFLSVLMVEKELVAKRIQSVSVHNINISQEVVLITNYSYSTILLGRLYRHCLLIANPQSYLNFVSIIKER